MCNIYKDKKGNSLYIDENNTILEIDNKCIQINFLPKLFFTLYENNVLSEDEKEKLKKEYLENNLSFLIVEKSEIKDEYLPKNKNNYFYYILNDFNFKIKLDKTKNCYISNEEFIMYDEFDEPILILDRNHDENYFNQQKIFKEINCSNQ